jgi:hypothetical protein
MSVSWLLIEYGRQGAVSCKESASWETTSETLMTAATTHPPLRCQIVRTSPQPKNLLLCWCKGLACFYHSRASPTQEALALKKKAWQIKHWQAWSLQNSRKSSCHKMEKHEVPSCKAKTARAEPNCTNNFVDHPRGEWSTACPAHDQAFWKQPSSPCISNPPPLPFLRKTFYWCC